MRRKDILIISAILIVITFGAVFAIYYTINDGNILKVEKETVPNLMSSEKNIIQMDGKQQ